MSTRNQTFAVLFAAVGLCLIGCAGPKKPVPVQAAAAQERTPIYEHDGLIVARASIHNHTIYSDGRHTPEALLDLAWNQGMAVLAITDHREDKMCLGKSEIFCLRNGGVEKVGYSAYYDHLRKIQAAAKERGMIVIKGVEVSPYIFNNGKFPLIEINGSYNHFPVYGIEDPALLENMPARSMLRVRHEQDPNLAPYQAWVDYIAAHGGIVHAAHVEDVSDGYDGPIHSSTPWPVRNLLIRKLTGFSVLPDGWEEAGGPGGMWDVALATYMTGLREKPLWANGDADYHGPHGSLATATTLFYMKEFTEAEIYNCMREGRMVALQGAAFQDVYVSEWWVNDGSKTADSVMLGREVKLSGAPTVRFALSREVPNTTLRLIRNGKLVAEVPGSEILFTDTEIGERRQPCYYRVQLDGPHLPGGRDYSLPLMPDSELFVNPIFVRF